MKRRQVVLTIALTAATATAAAAQTTVDVAYCMYCTTDAQFAAAGVGEFGPAAVGPREALVINPGTVEVRKVTLRRSTNGRMHVAIGSSISAAEVKRLTDPDLKAEIFVPACNGVIKVLPSESARANTQSGNVNRKIERGTLVELRDGIYGIVLCQGPQFASLSAADRTALSTAFREARLRWQVSTFKGGRRTYGQMKSGNETDLVPAPGIRGLCAIFNNGDSACYQLHGKHSVSGGKDTGSAKSADLTGGMEIVNKGSTIEWGAPGSKGLPGETWLACNDNNGRISDCRTTTR